MIIYFMNRNKSHIFRGLIILLLLCTVFVFKLQAVQTSGLSLDMIVEKSVSGTEFPIVSIDKATASIRYDSNDYKGVTRAIFDLQNDINSVTSQKPGLLTSESAKEYEIIIGTIGKSKWIDTIIKSKKLDVKNLKGKWESFLITTIDNPQPGTKKCLLIVGSDKRGTIYGIYELAQQLGVSPWYWWADVPAMWMWSFYADDPLNSQIADEMGVVIGTSHHEPMARNHQEWTRKRKEHGAWNYATNQAVIDKFFTEGIERMKNTEDIVTIGMRGDGDEAMSNETDVQLLERVVKNQRNIIEQVTKRPAKETPQIWALYKEVLDYYDAGMRVPDDVIMLLCDDNWGNVHRLPNEKERKHPGGWGLYYHVDYVGAPRNTKWMNVTPIQNMWEQLQLTYDYGVDKLWVLNVGDIKPMEYPITLFMDMAWNPTRYTAKNLLEHPRAFCKQQFGEDQANEAMRILNLYSKYNGRVTAEMLDRNTYNLETGEWKQVSDEYLKLEAEA